MPFQFAAVTLFSLFSLFSLLSALCSALCLLPLSVPSPSRAKQVRNLAANMYMELVFNIYEEIDPLLRSMSTMAGRAKDAKKVLQSLLKMFETYLEYTSLNYWPASVASAFIRQIFYYVDAFWLNMLFSNKSMCTKTTAKELQGWLVLIHHDTYSTHNTHSAPPHSLHTPIPTNSIHGRRNWSSGLRLRSRRCCAKLPRSSRHSIRSISVHKSHAPLK
jgi:hypothetical protein